MLAAWLLLLTATTPLNAGPPAHEEAEAVEAVGAPVQFRGQTLFVVRAPIAGRSPSERAAAIEARLKAIAAGSPSVLQALRAEGRDGATAVLAGDVPLVMVTDEDARPTGRTRQQLAADVVVHAREALEREFEGRSLKGLITAGLYSLVATVLLALLLLGVRAAHPRLQTGLRVWRPNWIPTLRVGSLDILSADRVGETAAWLARTVRLAVVALAVAVYLAAVLGFFPWTRGFAERVAAYVLGAVSEVLLAIWGYLPNVVYLALIVVVTRWILRLLRLVATELEKGALVFSGFRREWAAPTYKIARFLVLGFAAVAAFPYLPGSHSPAFQGISIFVGVLFSLGSSSAISNVIAGIALTYMRPFAIGDRVKIADTVGDVIEMSLLVVRVRTIKNVDVTMANSMVLGNHIVNYSANAQGEGLIVHTTITIGYDAPWKQVHGLLIAAARDTEGISPRPSPFVLQTALNDFFVSYEINAYTSRANEMAAIHSRLHAQIQDHFNRAGVEIMSSHYLNLRDGNAVTIPEAHRAPGYAAPTFHVETSGAATDPVAPPVTRAKVSD